MINSADPNQLASSEFCKDRVYPDSAGLGLTLSRIWANSADDKLMIFFLFFPENTISLFMQIVSPGDNLHDMSNLFSEKNKKNISKCHLLNFLPSMLTID